jgi:hypothetical protein
MKRNYTIELKCASDLILQHIELLKCTDDLKLPRIKV